MTHRILVVDDEPDITALVAFNLAKAGYRVSTAANGLDALKAAKDERPDVIVLDLKMPGMDGIEEVVVKEEAVDGKAKPLVVHTEVSKKKSAASA